MTKYTKQTWANDEVGDTPVDADALNHMENGIYNAAVLADLATVATSGSYTDLANKPTIPGGGAPVNSPAFTGTPTAPNPTDGDDSTRIATTHYVQDNLDAKVDVSALGSSMLDALPGIPQVVLYASGWPTNSAYSDARRSWFFYGGDSAHQPPTVAGFGSWEYVDAS